MEHRIGAHRHVVMSDIELVHWVVVPGVETHGGHVVFRNVHFVCFFALRKLLVHSLVLSERGACKVGLVHLHLVSPWCHHIHEHG
jgi:hypothetical protein